jgi:hypothetical protein
MGFSTPTQGMGVFATYTGNASHLGDTMCGPAGKIEELHSNETLESTKSPNSGPEYHPQESLVMEDDSALALMGPPTLNRLSTDEQFYPQNGPFATNGMVQRGDSLPLESMMPQQAQEMAPRRLEPIVYHEVPPMEMQSNQPMPAMQQNNSPEVDMNNNMTAPVSPNNNNTMMYSDMMMQQAMQQAMQQGMQMQQWQQGVQYVPVPTPVPVQMMPQMMPQMVPVPVPMNFPVPGQQMQQMQQMQYYMVQQGSEQQRAEDGKPNEGFLESLMPKGWRKRQRPSKRPASRVQKVPNGRKIFVGGLSPNSTAESLIKHFCEFGKISDASVIHEAVSRKSRGFGYVEFQEKIPDGLLDMEHFIDQRRCGVRGYNYDPADDVAASAA